MEIYGANGTALVFTDNVEEAAINQIKGMLDHPMSKGSTIRVMPDVHAGAGSTIGTTIMLPEKRGDWRISPNVVGVDIGCGMMSYNIGNVDLDLNKVDIEIKRAVPVGTNVHSSPKLVEFTDKIYHSATFKAKNEDRIKASLGTLGGGNHFIEISVDENGDKWLTVHSGSRNFGLQVAKHHQKIAEDLLGHKDPLAFLQGELLENYLKDMSLAQEYAKMNRKVMLDLISSGCGFSIKDSFDSIHNFIDIKNGIIRKGATSAEDGERLIIPLNMRDGSLVCSGKGNSDWNYSAPHGAGRAMGRREAKSKLSFEDYKKTMSGVYSTSLSLDNIDEAPMAYKPAENILRNIPDTAEVIHHLKPIYNRKG